MDAEEIARLIGELENRVERLRSLYEQYFMGIERIEPLTLRKEVERRLWALRREQIRNTGLRFKLETTIQRYNTYQQYWQRIVREIEAGTYQRDIGRAAQRFGDNVVTAFARRRQKMYEKGLEKKVERDQRRTGAGATSQAPPAEAVEEAPPSSNEIYEVDFEDAEAAQSTAAHSAAAQSKAVQWSAVQPAAPTAHVPPLEPHEPLELEIGEPAPPPPPRAAPPPRALGAGLAAGAPPVSPPPPPVTPSIGLGPAAKPPAPAVALAKPATPIATAKRTASPVPAKPGALAGARERPASSAVSGADVKPATPVATPAKPAVSAVRSPTPAAARPAVPAARPVAPSRPDAPRQAVLGEDNSLSPIRLRQIYGAFVEAKRKANESTAAVTYEKIASNLESVAKELRAKHNAKSVDFEVVMKNGKPVLKPVVKG